jgi:hypothetical protein
MVGKSAGGQIKSVTARRKTKYVHRVPGKSKSAEWQVSQDDQFTTGRSRTLAERPLPTVAFGAGYTAQSLIARELEDPWRGGGIGGMRFRLRERVVKLIRPGTVPGNGSRRTAKGNSRYNRSHRVVIEFNYIRRFVVTQSGAASIPVAARVVSSESPIVRQVSRRRCL